VHRSFTLPFRPFSSPRTFRLPFQRLLAPKHRGSNLVKAKKQCPGSFDSIPGSGPPELDNLIT
jgi:hypothetical protein